MSSSNNLHWRSLLIGVVLGAIASAVGFLLFGDQAKESVATATEELGEGVQRVGKKIERTGEKLE